MAIRARLATNCIFPENHGTDMISFMPKIILLDLFPDATELQRQEIAVFFKEYCATVWRIYERLEREHPEVIDDLVKISNMKAKVDSFKNTN